MAPTTSSMVEERLCSRRPCINPQNRLSELACRAALREMRVDNQILGIQCGAAARVSGVLIKNFSDPDEYSPAASDPIALEESNYAS